MACYCANFYGSINCHNQVTRFGDRCKLCIALKSGASMSSGLLSSDSESWSQPVSSSSRHPKRQDSYGSSGNSSGSSRPTRGDSRYSRKQ
ncbi:hypothetical protein PspLS_08204 [Pyricularia sp. CBS 133598]|nr:hypothetical protein PspLS_08204 [Pyricularia sp. CBS 133598]